MFRKSLAQGQGMLFIFERLERQFFYMKNMNFPLDILWLDAHKKIVGIVKYFQPEPPNDQENRALAPLAPALYALEVNAGFCDKYKLQVGDKVGFSLP